MVSVIGSLLEVGWGSGFAPPAAGMDRVGRPTEGRIIPERDAVIDGRNPSGQTDAMSRPNRFQIPGEKAVLSPREAVALLKALEAPVAPVDVMIEESIAGRYP